ncbi:MAG: hypothetical protein CBE29_01520 [Rickettsiales bacterium TMED269]|nr:hypothetical protein [Rhodobiaceae bacterium]OUX40653.1 MAG: hypothetical protein CBE29_01520 [Rickettsiales bacterium TMED269]
MFCRLFLSLIFIFNLSLLSGCGSELSDVLGTNKLPPDEFTILTKPPLIVPPEYNLRPPAEGEIRPNAQQPNRQLQSILFGQNKTDDFSSSEISLMTGSDVAEAIPNIKEVLDSEMRDVEEVSPNLESQVLNSTSEVLK